MNPPNPPPEDTKRPPPPEADTRDTRAARRREWLRPERLAEQARQHYAELVEDQVWDARVRTEEGLRRRADGSPSAAPPQSTLPVSYWAVVEAVPDGGEGDTVENRLADYELWLKALKKNGLYTGPTKLTRINEEYEEQDGE